MICSLTDVKKAKNITGASAHDAELTRLILAAEQFVKDYCWRVFDYEASITEFFSVRSRRTNKLLVGRPPIVSISALYDDPLRTYAAGTLVPATDYVIADADAGIIELDGYSFNLGLNNIKLVYAGGFQELAAPAMPTVTPQGTPGSTAYGYKITAVNNRGETESSPEGTTATGNATLNGTNFNRITWTAVAGAIAYRVYKTTPSGSKGFLRQVPSGTLSYDDNGTAVPDGIDAPSENRSGIPNDLRQAAVELVWTARDKGDQALFGVRSKSIADGNIAYLNNDWPAGVAQVLDFYRMDLRTSC